jgi:hypothetical protein
MVPRRNGAIREEIQTSPVHFEYTKHMRGVFVADQLRASYSCQNRSHKWWHRVFLFLIDMTVVNMFIMYSNECKNGEHPPRPMTHLQFRTTLCEHLLQGWERRNCPAAPHQMDIVFMWSPSIDYHVWYAGTRRKGFRQCVESAISTCAFEKGAS